MRTLLPVVILLSLHVSILAQERPVSLADFVQKDIRKLDAKLRADFVRLFREAACDSDALSEQDWDMIPDKFYEFQGAPPTRLFLEIAPGFEHPGFCALRVHVFDGRWNRTSVDVFSTGYRKVIQEVRCGPLDVIDGDVLIVMTKVAGPYSKADQLKYTHYQYYAAVRGQLMLIRIEDLQHKIVRNDYGRWKIPAIGRNRPTGTNDELLNTLDKGQTAERLALLVWLSGYHLSSSDKRFEGINQEKASSSRQFEEVHASPRLSNILNELATSENDWIKAYASLAREPQIVHF